MQFPRARKDTPADPAAVEVSEELRAPVPTGIELCYQTFGTPTDDPLLLVMGLGGPMTWWDEELCRLLATRGFYVVRYDNRDTGRSGRGRGRVTRKMLVRAFLGRTRRAPYSLSDMADDAVGLLDHLGITKAHAVGVSMGGMIVQTLALDHPDRLARLVSIMSTTGRRSVGWQDPRLLPMLLARRQRSREDYIAASAKLWAVIGSPRYPEDQARISDRAGETFDRGVTAAGVLRQMMAVLTQPNRTRALHGVTVPAAVIHGSEDKMVHVSGGRATAAAIPGAELTVIEGMGHNMPEQLWPSIADVIRRTADRA